VFSAQAHITHAGAAFTLLDTPGHVDFAAEMERTLHVLDCAVLVISGSDGVQAHTETLWRLLRRYDLPVFLFVTKMDLPGAARAALLADLRAHLSARICDFPSAPRTRTSPCAPRGCWSVSSRAAAWRTPTSRS
jgi:small GTP-binding protein